MPDTKGRTRAEKSRAQALVRDSIRQSMREQDDEEVVFNPRYDGESSNNHTASEAISSGNGSCQSEGSCHSQHVVDRVLGLEGEVGTL